jgi:hypothetical protein
MLSFPRSAWERRVPLLACPASVGQAVPDEVAAMGFSRVRHSLTYKGDPNL